MQTFLEPLSSLSEIESLKEGLQKKKKLYGLTGCIEAGISHLVFGIGEGYPWKLVVCADDARAKELWEEYVFFDEAAVYYPAKDLLFYQSDIHGNALEKDRILALTKIVTEEKCTIFTTMDALLNRQPSQTRFLENIIHLSIGAGLNLKWREKKLRELGFNHVTQVEGPGEFSIRGVILDVFSIQE